MDNQAPDPKNPEGIEIGDIVSVLHKILDFRGEVIDAVRAQGKVTKVETGYGNQYPFTVIIEFDNRTVESVFPIQDTKLVEKGAKGLPPPPTLRSKYREITFDLNDFKGDY